jgi:hypothetical protein
VRNVLATRVATVTRRLIGIGNTRPTACAWQLSIGTDQHAACVCPAILVDRPSPRGILSDVDHGNTITDRDVRIRFFNAGGVTRPSPSRSRSRRRLGLPRGRGGSFWLGAATQVNWRQRVAAGQTRGGIVAASRRRWISETSVSKSSASLFIIGQ